MVEDLLLGLGLNCGTSKNFNTKILDAMRKGQSQMWYFLTPIKSKDNGSGFFEAQITLGFPVLCVQSDISEAAALARISEIKAEVVPELLSLLKKWVNVPAVNAIIIPFFANEKGESERNERKDFGNVRIHLIKLQITVKYRNSWIGSCEC